jgi:hypothetical protein
MRTQFLRSRRVLATLVAVGSIVGAGLATAGVATATGSGVLPVSGATTPAWTDGRTVTAQYAQNFFCDSSVASGASTNCEVGQDAKRGPVANADRSTLSTAKAGSMGWPARRPVRPRWHHPRARFRSPDAHAADPRERLDQLSGMERRAERPTAPLFAGAPTPTESRGPGPAGSRSWRTRAPSLTRVGRLKGRRTPACRAGRVRRGGGC